MSKHIVNLHRLDKYKVYVFIDEYPRIDFKYSMIQNKVICKFNSEFEKKVFEKAMSRISREQANSMTIR